MLLARERAGRAPSQPQRRNRVSEGTELGEGGRGQSRLGTSERPRARLRSWGAVPEAVGHPEGFDTTKEGDWIHRSWGSPVRELRMNSTEAWRRQGDACSHVPM